jgi:L-2-hydroxyglutarate oxidase LhgO
VGIRPQLIRSNGQLLDDLVIESTRRSIHILNVVSPGMTSSLAFAKWFSAGLTDRLEWTGRASEAAACHN